MPVKPTDSGAATGYETELWAMEEGGSHADVPGLCKAASLDEVRKHGYVLTPGRYVGVEPQEDGGGASADNMHRLVAELRIQQAQGARVEAAITTNLKALGFGKRG